MRTRQVKCRALVIEVKSAGHWPCDWCCGWSSGLHCWLLAVSPGVAAAWAASKLCLGQTWLKPCTLSASWAGKAGPTHWTMTDTRPGPWSLTSHGQTMSRSRSNRTRTRLARPLRWLAPGCAGSSSPWSPAGASQLPNPLDPGLFGPLTPLPTQPPGLPANSPPFGVSSPEPAPGVSATSPQPQ